MYCLLRFQSHELNYGNKQLPKLYNILFSSYFSFVSLDLEATRQSAQGSLLTLLQGVIHGKALGPYAVPEIESRLDVCLAHILSIALSLQYHASH